MLDAVMASSSEAASASKSQLLRELEALSQALYEAQQRVATEQSQLQASRSKNGVFASLSEGDVLLPGSGSPGDDGFIGDGGRKRSGPYSLDAAFNQGIRPAVSLDSDHSLVIPKPKFTKADNLSNRRRFSASASTQQQVGLIDVGEMADTRSRYDRRAQSWSCEAFMSEEVDFRMDENGDFSRKLETPFQKKRSIWNWKPFRALSHIGRQRFHCVFSAHVHAIEGLPTAMNGLRLAVHLRKEDTKEGEVQTLPSRILQGIAEFQEILYMKCSIYGTKSSSRGMKFMSRYFFLSVFAPDVDELDFGVHQLDLSRLLAESIVDKRGQLEKNMKWNTSFELSGKAKGARVMVTFDYEILDKDSRGFRDRNSRFVGSPNRGAMQSSYSVPNSAYGTPTTLIARAHADFSPSMSEAGNEIEHFFAMEHLSLDEEIPVPGGNEPLQGMDTQMHGLSSFLPCSEPPPSASQQVVDETAGFEPKLTGFSQSNPGSGPLWVCIPDASDGTQPQPKMGNFPQGVSGSGSRARNFSLDDSSLAPATPIQSLEDSDSMRKTAATRQTTGEDAVSEEETEFEAVEQGSEGCELQEIVTFERGAEVVEPNRGQNNLNEADACVCATENLSDAPYQTVNLEHCPGELQSDLQENVCNQLKESHPNQLQESVHIEIGQLQYEVAAGGPEVDGKKPITTQMITLTLDSFLQDDAAVQMQHREAFWDATISECKEVNTLEVVQQQEVNTLAVQKIKRDAFEVVIQQEAESVEKGREENLDNEVDLVAGEFIHMLETEDNALGPSTDNKPDSRRAQLLKHFDKEALLEGGLGSEQTFPEVPESTLDGGINELPVKVTSGMQKGVGHFIEEHSSSWDNNDDRGLVFIINAADTELKRATQSIRSKTRAKILEDAETEALMQEWGLNENAFTNSPPKQIDAIAFARFQDPLPPTNGLGAVVHMKDGSSLRFMRLAHFQSSKNGGKLVIHVSKPVVVPAEMGSGAVDVFRNMAATGLENLAAQAMAAMPLEDITGQSLQEIAMEGIAAEKSLRKGYASEQSGNHAKGHSFVTKSLAINLSAKTPRAHATMAADDEFVSLEDLCPMAMRQIEALTFEGLKIQSDMAEEDAPYALNAREISFADTGFKDNKAAEKQCGLGMVKSVAGAPLLHEGKTVNEGEISRGSNGLLALAISLDEWVCLNPGLYHDTDTDKNMLAKLKVQHAVKKDIVGSEHNKNYDRENKIVKNARCGFMGNTLTMTMLVQLRNPSHNYEAVGSPMIVLVQAEHVMLPSNPKLGETIILKGDIETDDEADGPLFKITGVHVAGLKASENDKKNGWGSQEQQQSASKWLIGHGMTKNTKNHPLPKSKLSPTSSLASGKTLHRDLLWSISSRSHSGVSKWKEATKLNSHIRNPDVKFGNQNTKRKTFI